MPILHPPPLAHTDEESLAEKLSDAQRERMRDVEGIRKIAADTDGRRFLQRLLEWTNVMGPSRTAEREGERRIGSLVIGLLDEADLALFPGLLAENAAEEVRRRAAPPDG